MSTLLAFGSHLSLNLSYAYFIDSYNYCLVFQCSDDVEINILITYCLRDSSGFSIYL